MYITFFYVPVWALIIAFHYHFLFPFPIGYPIWAFKTLQNPVGYPYSSSRLGTSLKTYVENPVGRSYHSGVPFGYSHCIPIIFFQIPIDIYSLFQSTIVIPIYDHLSLYPFPFGMVQLKVQEVIPLLIGLTYTSSSPLFP